MGKRELVNLLEKRLRPLRRELLQTPERPDFKPVKLLVERVLAELRDIALETVASGDEFRLTKVCTIRPKHENGEVGLDVRLYPALEAEILERLEC